MKEKYKKINNLTVDGDLADFVQNELLKDTEIDLKNLLHLTAGKGGCRA